MNDIYQTPKSELTNDSGIVIKPHGFWKVFFWIHVVLSPLLILMIFTTENISGFDYFDLLTFPFVLAVLFGYVFSKKIGFRIIWKVSCIIYPLWYVFYEIIAPFFLNLPQYGELATFDAYFIVSPLFAIPTCYALYLYGFKAEHVWSS